MALKTLKTEFRGRVALVTLNRPEALNALSTELLGEMRQVMRELADNDQIGAVVITGSEKAFAAGADIKEMQTLDFMGVYVSDFFEGWSAVANLRKPVIAAVAGYALGGGCELAMMCDFIIAADTAKFGQPEITLGVIPGMGGTQRLTRAVGKAKAMDLCLTGRMMDAEEAERSGLVARVVPADELIDTAIKAAEKIAGFPLPATMMVKEAVNRVDEVSLAEGLRFERRLFHSLFATEDQKEGMTAFVDKRKAEFKHR